MKKKRKDKIIRSTKHSLKFANKNKRSALPALREDYIECLEWFIDYLWNNQIITKSYGKDHNLKKVFILDVANKWYECPNYISTVGLDYPKNGLSARMIKCCATQACSMVRAVLEAPRRHQWILAQCLTKGESTDKIKKRIKNHKFSKPMAQGAKMELNSICVDFQMAPPGAHFHGWLQLKSISKKYGKIRFPIQLHRQSKKHSKNGKLLNSFLIGMSSVDLRWEKPVPPAPTRPEGPIVGGDQGYHKVIALAGAEMPPLIDNHGYSYEDIHDKLKRKKKGSKSFARAQAHRINYTNWFINQIQLPLNATLVVENIPNIKKGRRTSRLMSHWSNPLIVSKAESFCQEKGVLFLKCNPAYRSQRCNKCGWVSNRNRKGESFCCQKCGHKADADFNAAENIRNLNLPEIRSDWLKYRLNRNGFYWTEEGFSLTGGDFYSTPFHEKND